MWAMFTYNLVFYSNTRIFEVALSVPVACSQSYNSIIYEYISDFSLRHLGLSFMDNFIGFHILLFLFIVPLLGIICN